MFDSSMSGQITLTTTSSGGNFEIAKGDSCPSGSGVIPDTYSLPNMNCNDNPIAKIAASAFANCEAIHSITIGNKVEWIGAEAFSGCSALKFVRICGTVRQFDERVFAGCVSLATVRYCSSTVPTVCTVDPFGESSLQAIFIGNSLVTESVGSFAFCGTTIDVMPVLGDECEVTGQCWRDISTPIAHGGVITVQMTGYGFNSGEAKLAAWGKGGPFGVYVQDATLCPVGSGTISDSHTVTGSFICNDNPITRVSDNAFSGCSAMTGIALGVNVGYIGTNAFSGCSALMSITTSSVVKTVGDGAFTGCTSMNSFHYCSATVPIVCPASDPFDSCTALTTVSIGAESDASGGWCGTAKEVVAELDGCDPEPVQAGLCRTATGAAVSNAGKFTVSGYMFTGSQGEVQFSCVGVGGPFELARSSCPTGDGHIPDTHTVEHTLYDCVENPIVGISNDGFRDCSGIIGITLGSNVQWIGTSAFSGCTSMMSVVIVRKVNSIGEGAFDDCMALLKFHYCASTAPVVYPSSDLFASCLQLTEVNVGIYTDLGLGWCGTQKTVVASLDECIGDITAQFTQSLSFSMSNTFTAAIVPDPPTQSPSESSLPTPSESSLPTPSASSLPTQSLNNVPTQSASSATVVSAISGETTENEDMLYTDEVTAPTSISGYIASVAFLGTVAAAVFVVNIINVVRDDHSFSETDDGEDQTSGVPSVEV